jgi:hypothetical protein
MQFVLLILSLACLAYAVKYLGALPGGMAITVVKDTTEVQFGGGNILYLRNVASTGADLGSPDTNHVMPHIIDSKVPGDIEPTKTTTFEDGSKVEGRVNRDVIWEFTFGQNSLALHNLKEEVKGKVYRVYYQDAPMVNGKVKEFMGGICVVFIDLPGEHKADTEVLPKMRVRVTKNAAAITILNATLPAEKKTAGVMDIAAGAYYSMAET